MKILITTLFLGTIFLINAQATVEKTSIGILPFSYSSGSVNSSDGFAISESVVNSFVETKRFNVVDRTKLNALEKEKELQKTEDFIDGDALVAQGKSIGAQYLVSGHISNVDKRSEWKTRTKSDGSTEKYEAFSASISFSVKIISVESGEIINSQNFQTGSGGGFLSVNPKNKEDAFIKSISSLKREIDAWVGVNFPLEIPLVEVVSKSKNGEPAVILIAAGSDYGMVKGEKLKVMEVTEVNVNGAVKTRKKEIGTLKINNVDDGSFSTCSVKSGASEIQSALDSSKKIIIQTYR
jgi:hypothetical protein